MQIATSAQVHEFMSRAQKKKLDLIDLKDAAIAANWTIILDGQELKLEGNLIIFLAHNPEKIRVKRNSTKVTKPPSL
jgi:hypothetical protein